METLLYALAHLSRRSHDWIYGFPWLTRWVPTQEIEAWYRRCIFISFIVLIVQHSVRALPQVMPHTQSVLPDLKYYRLT